MPQKVEVGHFGEMTGTMVQITWDEAITLCATLLHAPDLGVNEKAAIAIVSQVAQKSFADSGGRDALQAESDRIRITNMANYLLELATRMQALAKESEDDDDPDFRVVKIVMTAILPMMMMLSLGDPKTTEAMAGLVREACAGDRVLKRVFGNGFDIMRIAMQKGQKLG